MFWTRTIKLNKPTMLISLHINFLSNNTNYKLNVIIFIKKISDTHYFGQRARSVIPNWPFPRPSTQRARDETLSQNPHRRCPPFTRPTPSFVALPDPHSSLLSCSSIPNPPPSPPQVINPRPQIHRPQPRHLLLRSSTLARKLTATASGLQLQW